MKTIGVLTGFVIGFGGFLLLFKIFILENIAPQDEIAPGMVMIAAVLIGLAFAFLGR